MWFQDINRIYRIHIWMQAKWLKCHFNDDGEGCVRTSRRVGSSCISVGWEGWNGYALNINFAKHTITSFTRRVHTNRLELWSFSQGVQASLVRQQSWRGGISNESNSHADICKTHGQWIHCFKQSHQSYLPTGQWPGLNHLVFRVAKCLACGQKFKKSLQNTAYKYFLSDPGPIIVYPCQ